MLAWLKAFRHRRMHRGRADPKSREFYHPYAHPEKFDGLPGKSGAMALR